MSQCQLKSQLVQMQCEKIKNEIVQAKAKYFYSKFRNNGKIKSLRNLADLND